MSVEAISWALNLAPVPADRGGQPSSACKFVLVGLANHAGPDGSCAFPAVRTLTRYTALSERTVRACLGRLEAAGLIRPCDPAVVAARIKRADRRPRGWDLNLSQIRDDLADQAVAAPERQYPGLAARLTATPGRRVGVQSLHPDAAVDNPESGVQPLHPAAQTGCSQRTSEVQSAHSRGAATAPEPYKEPSQEPAAPAPAREAPRAAGAADGGGPTGEFFAALGPGWRLTAAQRVRLAPAVTTALDAGWTPQALAAFTGANTTGVRNPYAVLAARLSPAELPPPPARRPPRPPWCGECDQATRLLGFDGDAPRPCPRCKLASAASSPPAPAPTAGDTGRPSQALARALGNAENDTPGGSREHASADGLIVSEPSPWRSGIGPAAGRTAPPPGLLRSARIGLAVPRRCRRRPHTGSRAASRRALAALTGCESMTAAGPEM